MEEWRRRMATGDVDGLLALTTDDVVFLTPGNPPFGKAEFAEGFRKVSAKARIAARQDVKEIHVSHDVAYAWSHLTASITAKDGVKRANRPATCSPCFARTPMASGDSRATRISWPAPATRTGSTADELGGKLLDAGNLARYFAL